MMESGSSAILNSKKMDSRRRRSDWRAQELATHLFLFNVLTMTCCAESEDSHGVRIQMNLLQQYPVHFLFLFSFRFMWLHTVVNRVPVAHLAKSARRNSITRFFVRGYDPSLMLVSPGRWLTLFDLPWGCHCHCHCAAGLRRAVCDTGDGS